MDYGQLRIVTCRGASDVTDIHLFVEQIVCNMGDQAGAIRPYKPNANFL
jgi:hypothetical protein